MSLLNLPDKLLLCVANHLSKLKDINSLARTNHQTYHTLNKHLYQFSIPNYPLEWCAWRGSLQHVQLHLDMGTSSLDKALYAATVGCKYSIMETLIEHGADVNVRMSNGFTPLHAAACVGPSSSSGNARGMQILLKNEPNLYKRTRGPLFRGHIALHLACGLGNLEVVKLLLETGIDTKATSSRHLGTTPLSLALQGLHQNTLDCVVHAPIGVTSHIIMVWQVLLEIEI